MFFWFKKKTIVIDAFTGNQLVHQQYPISRATKHVPEWWKRLPATLPTPGFELVPEATSKYCQGFIDLYSQGFMLPLWSDVAIELTWIDDQRNFKWQFADRITNMDFHEYRAIEGMVTPDRYQHFKIPAPWVVNSKSDTKFLMIQPVWSHGDNINKFTVLPGIIDFKYQFSVNVNTFFEYIKGTARQTFLEAGTPLAHLIPLTEDKVEIRCHEVSKEEFDRKTQVLAKFKGNYRERKTRINNSETSKCPFKRWH